MNAFAPAINRAKLNAIMAYQHPGLVDRLQRKMSLSQVEAELLFEDTKRFLFVSTEYNDSMAPPPKIDECWHHFILFTRDYAAFCRDLAGKFIHHCPHQPGESPDHKALNSSTLANAKIVFGDNLSTNWLSPTLASCNDECQATTNCQDSTSDCSN